MKTVKKQYAWIPLLLFLFFITGCGRKDMKIRTVGEETESTAVIQVDESGPLGITKKESTSSDETSGSKEETVTTDETASVTVYVCGAVMHEGVYTLEQGARVEDALAAAGGYNEDAATGILNLAGPVTDGEMIRFPTKEEVENGDYPTGQAGNPNGGQNGNSNGGQAGSPGTGQTADGRINLNTATKEELITLPGIGEQRAEDILRYREENGSFRDIRELMNVSGIKDGVFDKLKDKITVDE